MESTVDKHRLAFWVRKIRFAIEYRLWRGPLLRRQKARVMDILGSRDWPKTVLTGPFRGLHYIGTSTGSAFLPKIMGTYEASLHPWIERIARSSYRHIYVVGCAEGYYACGIKKLLPNTPLYAFDSNPRAQTLCRELAEANGLDISIHGHFVPNDWDIENSLLLVDIEGFEAELLNPEKHPQLRHCDVLVETHDYTFGYGNITRDLINRFSSSHSIDIKTLEHNDIQEMELASSLQLPVDVVRRATDELRPGVNRWLYLESSTATIQAVETRHLNATALVESSVSP